MEKLSLEQQRDSTPQPLSSWTNTQKFNQTGQMIEVCCEFLSVRCIWLHVIIMSRTSFRVNPHSIVCVNVKELLARSRCHNWSLSDSQEVRTHNHLVRKRTLNHLAKLAKWLSCVVNSYLYGAFDSMLLSCHVKMTEWLSVRLRTKWLWVWISLLSLKPFKASASWSIVWSGRNFSD